MKITGDIIWYLGAMGNTTISCIEIKTMRESANL